MLLQVHLRSPLNRKDLQIYWRVNSIAIYSYGKLEIELDKWIDYKHAQDKNQFRYSGVYSDPHIYRRAAFPHRAAPVIPCSSAALRNINFSSLLLCLLSFSSITLPPSFGLIFPGEKCYPIFSLFL